jgi:hypothetical protein
VHLLYCRGIETYVKGTGDFLSTIAPNTLKSWQVICD